MRKAPLLLCSLWVLAGCTASFDIPLPESHPAHSFYQTANSFYVSSKSCMKAGGELLARPDKVGPDKEFEKLAEIAPGLWRLREKATGREFITVLFMEYGMAAAIPKTCSWNLEKFPLEEKPQS